MSSGPISSVPGFVRKEQPDVEPLPTTTPTPLISAVPPGIKASLSPADPDPTVASAPVRAIAPEAAAVPPVAPPAPPVAPTPPTAPAPPVAPSAPSAPSAPPAPPPSPVAPPATSPADDADFFVDFDAEETPSAPPVVSVVAVDDDHDDVEATRLASPRVVSLVLRWDDGTVTVITRPTVIGRGPVGGEGDEVEAIADPTLSLSKSHARFVAAPEASVTDLHSTNGMLVERAGAPIAVPPGVPIPLSHGDAVVFGKRRLVVEVAR